MYVFFFLFAYFYLLYVSDAASTLPPVNNNYLNNRDSKCISSPKPSVVSGNGTFGEKVWTYNEKDSTSLSTPSTSKSFEPAAASTSANNYLKTGAIPKYLPCVNNNGYRDKNSECTPASNCFIKPNAKNFHNKTADLSQFYFCKFCYKNKEPAMLFRNHNFRRDDGILACPVLRKYKCPICGATDDKAHTAKYCPLNKSCLRAEMTLNEIDQLNRWLSEDNEYNSFVPREYSTPIKKGFTVSQPAYVIDGIPTRTMFRKTHVCKYCFKNGKPKKVYESHSLRDEDGQILCPYLRNYSCPICKATGDNAHTKKYCPFNTFQSVIEHLFDD